MSLRFSPVTDGPAFCATKTKSRIVVGFASGRVRIYSAEDYALEREIPLGKSVVQVAAIPGTELVSTISDQKCSIHNLDTRKIVVEVDTRSARFVAGIPSWRAHSTVHYFVVGSSYKVRIYIFAGTKLTNSVVIDTPGRQKVRAVGGGYVVRNANSAASEPPVVYILLGSRAPRIWRLDFNTMQLSPIAVLDPNIFGSAHKFVVSCTNNYIFVGSSLGAQLLRISPLQIVKSWTNVNVRSSSIFLSHPLGVPLLAATLANGSTGNPKRELSLINPATGSTISRHPNKELCGSNNGFASGLAGGVLAVECDLSVSYITDLEDKHEAASMALQLPTECVTEQIRDIERDEASRIFKHGDTDEAMRLLLHIEEQEQQQEQQQEQKQGQKQEPDEEKQAPNGSLEARLTNHKFVLQLIDPYLKTLSRDDNSETHDEDSRQSGEVLSSRNSTFSAKTSAQVKQYHPLDAFVAYLVYTRRKLRLAHFSGASAAEIDTSLFRCYLLMHSKLVIPLLRSPNQCDPTVVTDELLARGKWRELVWFLRSRGETKFHKEALDILVEHHEPPESIASYLEQIHVGNSDDLELVFEYAKPIISRTPKLARSLFFENRDVDSSTVKEFLRSVDQDLGEEYVKFRVLEFGDDTPKLHNDAALILAAAAKADTGKEGALLKFLEESPSIDLQMLSENHLIPSRGRAWLHRRLGNYETAIDLCIEDAGDLETAQVLAETHNRTTYLFEKLLHSPSTGSLVNFLSTVSTSSDLEFAEALSKLPEDTKLEDVRLFLEKFAAADIAHSRKAEIQAAVSRQALTVYSIQLSENKKQKYIVDDSAVCSVCHKKLGRAVTGVVNGELVHYVCLKLL